jgi:DNA-binding CsgD family transcriptional regulator
VIASEKDGTKACAPPGVSAYRMDLDDELVLFVWESAPVSASLSAAERDVLQRVLDGYSNADIATARGTSSRTVANQVATLLRKLGAGSRFELIGRLARGAAAPSAKKKFAAKKRR